MLLTDIFAGGFKTASCDITRPADTTAYAIGDAVADSTAAVGGSILAGVVGATGKSGVITDMVIVSSNPAGGLAGEIFIFDSAVTAVTDNAVFGISDAEAKTLVGKIPFALAPGANNAHTHVFLPFGFTTVGSANLRFLVKVTAIYTPISGEVLTVRAKVQQID